MQSRTDQDPIADKRAALEARVRALGSAAIGFSGGVDSALLVKVAHDALGDRAVAVTTDSETLPREELKQAVDLAAEIGVAHRIVRARELARPGFAENAGDRCYFCKTELFDILEDVARREGLARIAYGATADDLGDHRPGMKAAEERGVAAPLLEAGLGKAEVRELARRLGLSVWDKPSFACLSSRFAYGNLITVEKLSTVESAEALLREKGFRQFRVRVHDRIARIEVPAEEIGRLLDRALREEIVARLKALGYAYVTLDLQGFRSGSMNEAL